VLCGQQAGGLLETSIITGEERRDTVAKMTNKNVLPEKGSEMTKKLKKDLENAWPICRKMAFLWFTKRNEEKTVVFYIRDEDVKLPMPVVTPVVRQAGQLFLPVCNHSSTQV